MFSAVEIFDQSIEKIYQPLDVKKMSGLINDELKRLRKNIYDFEADRINIFSFVGRSSGYNVYGQITGSRNSKRAFELANICGGEFSKCITRYVPVTISYEIKEWKEREFRNYTALEMYMATLDYRFFDHSELDIKEKINKILLYIKNETEKIDL